MEGGLIVFSKREKRTPINRMLKPISNPAASDDKNKDHDGLECCSKLSTFSWSNISCT